MVAGLLVWCIQQSFPLVAAEISRAPGPDSAPKASVSAHAGQLYGTFPRWLSQTGAFKDTARLTPADATDSL